MKSLFISLLLLIQTVSYAQVDEQSITLTVSGTGNSKETAQNNALRSAVEQAFGTFVSSKTEVLSDSIVKDEIISVSNGNISSYKIINETKVSDASWSVTVNAAVSVSKLITYAENKGFEAELKGALFAINIKKDELYKKNELDAVRNMSEIVKQIADKSFDWTISVKDPIKFTPSQYGKYKNEKDFWEVPISIGIKTNKNFNSIPTIIYNTLNALDYNVKPEITETRNNFGGTNLSIKDGREVFPITISIADDIKNCYIFRSDSTVIELLELINYFNHSILNFNIDNGVKVFSLDSLQINNMEYLDDNRGIGSTRWLVWENHQNTKLEIYDNFTIALAHWTLKTGGPPSKQVFLHSAFNRQDYETSFNGLPYYSYNQMQNVDKFLRERRGKQSVSYSRKMSIYDYSISQHDLEYLNLKGTAFNFLYDRKFIKSIPFITYGPVISFNSVINNSNELINIRCSHILNLKELGIIKSYKISPKIQ